MIVEEELKADGDVESVWYVRNEGDDTDGPYILLKTFYGGKHYLRVWLRTEFTEPAWHRPDDAVPLWNPYGEGVES